jgi:hypothetical protein
VQQIWKFNANESLAAVGAGLVILSFLVGAGLYSAGLGSGILGILAGVALLVVYYLKYTNTTIQWPAPVPVVALVIGVVMGIGALLSLLFVVQWFGLVGFTFTWILGPILNVIGGALGAWGTYKEWQATKTTTA